MTAQTWHYGVVARWWAQFNVDVGDEFEWFRPFIEAGQPALDAACGTGRLLIPYLHAGLDVDGSDISPDMLDLCRKRALREGLPPPNLYAQAMHELDLPRRYRTIFLCGGFGLGGNREQDQEGLRVWAVTCFVTRTGFRRRGVSRALACAAVDFARERGARALEGYPMITQPGQEITWGELHVGSRSIFAAAGFAEVTRPTLRRAVMRIDF